MVEKQDEMQTVIKRGLEAREPVVTTGFAQLTDGAAHRRSGVTRAAPGRDAAGTPQASAGKPQGVQTATGGGSGAAAQAHERHRRHRGGGGQPPAPMNVSAPFIHRPIATSLLGVAVLLGGLLGYLWLPVSALPQVDFPTIQVTTQLPGANPDTIASLVTAPLERQFGQIPALQTMTSSSSFGISQVTLQFDLNRDIDAAAQDVQSAINAAASALPRNLPYPPLYSKVNPADAPMITLALTSTTSDLRSLERHGRHHHGAAAGGSVRRRPRLGAGRHPPGDPHPGQPVAARRLRHRAGRPAHGHRRRQRRGAEGLPRRRATVLHHRRQRPDRAAPTPTSRWWWPIATARRSPCRDVAEVKDGLENDKVGGWYQGKPAVIIDVQRQPGANVIETVERVRAELPRLQARHAGRRQR